MILDLRSHARPGWQLRPPLPGGRSRFVVPILRSGVLARRFCRHVRFAEVVAAFDRSFYLGADDMFICIGEREIGDGPLTMVADGLSFLLSHLGVDRGQRAFISPRGIRIGDSVRLTFDCCERWCQPGWPPSLSPTGLIDTADALIRATMVRSPQAGLAQPVCCAHEGRGSPLARIASARIANFAYWLSSALRTHCAPAGALTEPVQRLIGLGPGLTPSGDDFLMGALALLDAIAERKAHTALARALIDASPASTSPLSYCFLRAAAAGYIGENLHRAVSSAISGKPDAAIAAIQSIGHSSGWDMLAGIATTLQIVAAARLET
jgi:Protein of unknown function (DUF2877)